MVLEQTITIVNNSGKIIKTGKQLMSIWKDAQGTYKEKKSELKAERATLNRSQTYDQSRSIPAEKEDPYQYYYQYDRPPVASRSRPPIAYDAGSEHGSQRSRRSRSVVSGRTALTEGNLKTLSEVSGHTASKSTVPRAYTNAYEENMDLAISKQDHMHAELRSQRAMSVRGPGTMVPRSLSATQLVETRKPRKEIDMDLAYGSVPPDLEFRTDLEPKHNMDETEATGLIHRVEHLLDEAHCMHHSASATISQLQKDPDSAAAVALSLAELSSLIKKTSPAFLTLMKSASPVVFHLLASPQFLIGSSIAMGVTVVCFGGWKIVQRVREQNAARALAIESAPMDHPPPLRRAYTEFEPGYRQPEYFEPEYSEGIDEALIIDDDLSSIETWRRGIVPLGEDDTADMELITPLAEKMYDKDDFDTKSRRSTRTTKTTDTHKSHRSHRSHRTRDERDKDSEHGSERRSRRAPESIADSERSHRSKRSSKSDVKSDAGRSRRGDDKEIPYRPKSHRNHSSSNMLKALFKPKKERDLVAA